MLESQRKLFTFCDASWGLDSVSGAIIIYKGCCIKFFSRKQEVPALSSAEAEIISIVETAQRNGFHWNVVANSDSGNPP